MESLIDVLAIYAAENLIPRFQEGPEAEEWVEALKLELLKIDTNHERATLLSGISIGLELGRL